MTRELAMVSMCTGATILVAWIVDHPSKISGTASTLVVFLIIVVIAKLRGDPTNHTARWNRGRHTGPPQR
jgi:uncharacterized membrane protein YqjE